MNRCNPPNYTGVAMKWTLLPAVTMALALTCPTTGQAQEDRNTTSRHTLFDIPPRMLIDMPTAGTLPRGHFNIGLRLYANGGALGNTDIGLSNRFMIGISYGGTDIVSTSDPEWNPRIGFSLKFRLIDELQVFPAVAVGFTDQGYGPYSSDSTRYTFKSRGFYAVSSRSFYFYKWTSSWHFGVNYSREYEGDGDKDIDLFGGFDATFNYNLALLLEYDAALNDDRGNHSISGKGRGYLNMSIKWLFAENLEIEVLLTDLLVNRKEAATFGRGMRIVYVDRF
jgi:hypothetical protein